MGKYRIFGEGAKISGVQKIGGAKNAVLPILAALCLNERESVIYNCPRIADTFISLEILNSMGFKTDFTGNTLKVVPPKTTECNIPDECVNKMRSSILFIGAMLACCGKIDIALPGGCQLGTRAIDLHIEGLKAMGATIEVKNDKLYCTAKKLVGARIKLHTASVGATENLMIAATKAKGITTIENAACEPEVVDLAKFLTSLGAKISGAGTSIIVIQGVEKLEQQTPHTIMPDRIVAGTFLVAAAITGGTLTVTDVDTLDLLPVIKNLSAMGCTVQVYESSITLTGPKKLKPLKNLATAIHPGFPTDMQPQFVTALTVASGQSVVKENIFDKRHQHAKELNKMGGDIIMSCDRQTFTINGVDVLQGTTVQAKDLRGGAALILAGLVAKGETIIENSEYVERGYEDIEISLAKLGANIVLEKH